MHIPVPGNPGTRHRFMGVAMTGLPLGTLSGAQAAQMPGLNRVGRVWWWHVLQDLPPWPLLRAVAGEQPPLSLASDLGAVLRTSARSVETWQTSGRSSLPTFGARRRRRSSMARVLPLGGCSRRGSPLRGCPDSRVGSRGVARPHRFARFISGPQPLAASRSFSMRAIRLSSGHSCGSSTYLQERVFKSFP
jgi:hypothetical protein